MTHRLVAGLDVNSEQASLYPRMPLGAERPARHPRDRPEESEPHHAQLPHARLLRQRQVRPGRRRTVLDVSRIPALPVGGQPRSARRRRRSRRSRSRSSATARRRQGTRRSPGTPPSACSSSNRLRGTTASSSRRAARRRQQHVRQGLQGGVLPEVQRVVGRKRGAVVQARRSSATSGSVAR